MTEPQIIGDGNCLFRTLAVHLFDDQERHPEVREKIALALRNDLDNKYSKNPHIYEASWTATLTGRKGSSSYADYVNHVSQPRNFGDIGCFHVAADIFEDFTFRIWTPVSRRKDPVALYLRSKRVPKSLIKEVTFMAAQHENVSAADSEKVLNVYYKSLHFELFSFDEAKLMSANDIVRYHFSWDDKRTRSASGSSSSSSGLSSPDGLHQHSALEESLGLYESRQLPVAKPLSPEQMQSTLSSTDYMDFILGQEMLQDTNTEGIISPKRRPKAVRISKAEGQLLLAYQCRHEPGSTEERDCQILGCIASGTAWNARVSVWGPEERGEASKLRRVEYMKTELRNGCYVINGKAFFRHKVGNYIICHDAWKRLFNFPKSSFSFWKATISAEAIQNVEIGEAGVNINKHKDDLSNPERGDSKGYAWAFAWLKKYNTECVISSL